MKNNTNCISIVYFYDLILIPIASDSYKLFLGFLDVYRFHYHS